MREVMMMRSALVASKMTMEEAKETRQKVTTKMDFLNHRLGTWDRGRPELTSRSF
jgi:hypothetical protein